MLTKELQDLAWRVLPKEFKEEMKKRYVKCLITANDDAMVEANLLIEIFGIHNLSSDAEGEEMLMVSRKRVQEMYYYNEDILSLDPTHSGAILLKKKLQDLFGPKCLPDNVESLDSNVDSLESKPAELRFKVGDMVRFKYCCTPYRIDGFKMLDGAMLYQVGEVWAEESDLEPYTEPEENVIKMKPIESKVSVYLATKEEDKEFRMLLHENGFVWNMGASLISDSHWSSGSESSKMHYVYPDKTVTYYGDKTSDTLTFTEFKKRYFGEDVNLSQETANCDKQFDNILKDSFRKHNRLHIAAMALSGLLANPNNNAELYDNVADALHCADALIAEAEKGGPHE